MGIPSDIATTKVPSSSIQLQPPHTASRSNSLPMNQLPSSSRSKIERNQRSLSITTQHIGAGSHVDPSPRRPYNSSPTYPMSPASSLKRQSLIAASHPYQRPSSAGLRKNSGDDVANNLLRYSQNLMQAQSQQLSNHAPMVRRNSSIPRPTSVPQGYAPVNNQSFSRGHMPGQVPQFRQPDWTQAPSPTGSDFSGTSGNREMMYQNYGRGQFMTSDSYSYSPVDASTMYSAATPELVSSTSLSTLDSRSSFNSTTLDSRPQVTMPYVNQPYMGVTFQQPQPGTAIIDPNQWTPGVDKMNMLANQWLEFSPQSTDIMYFPNEQSGM